MLPLADHFKIITIPRSFSFYDRGIVIMIPAKFAPLLFSFCLSIIMSCVVSGVATLNVAGLTNGVAAFWLAAWYKSWIVAFPTILVVGPLTRPLVARLTRDEPDKAGRVHRQ